MILIDVDDSSEDIIMKRCIEEDNNIGLVGYGDYNRQVIVPDSRYKVFINQEVLLRIGGFDRNTKSESATIIDIALKAIKMGYKNINIKCPYPMIKNNIESEYYEPDMEYLKKVYKMNYFNFTGNPFIVNSVNTDNRDNHIKVLEIGCDLGATLLDIKNKYPNATIVGTDINESAIKIAENILDTAFIGNIEDDDTKIHPDYYDYIIFGDVLEHLRDPLKVLIKVRDSLTDNGKIVACIPNLAHISVMKELIKGNFTYTDRGLLDKTHIHFFTGLEIKRMFDEAGYKLLSISSLQTNPDKEERELMDLLMTKSKDYVDRTHYTTFQYLCTAIKK